ncbi:MAG: dihydrodipicolinate synthase family protein [Roseiarcus sp.]|jgi:4-hydroxy-tetrahydrodipicolinate synthase
MLDPKTTWKGVFPAITTQFCEDMSIDVEATGCVLEALVADRVSGVVICGTVGENCSLTRAEKVALMELAVDVVRRRVPVIVGVAEYTAAFAVETVREAARAGLDGLMVLPPMVYPANPRETLAHFRSVATASDLPILIYTIHRPTGPISRRRCSPLSPMSTPSLRSRSRPATR